MRFKDQTSKEVVETLIVDIAKYILNIDIKEFEFIDKESNRIESRRADVVVKVNNEFILHIEIQNDNDNTMPIRMLRYFSDIRLKSIKDKNILPIKQYLIYIGKAKLNMSDRIVEDGIDYRYNLIDIRNIDCETLLKIDNPDALVLAILCDFKDKNPKDVVFYILKRLKELTKDDEFNFKRYVLMLEELSENRNLQKLIKQGEEMITDFDYTKLPSFDIGLQKGMQKGMQKGIEEGEKVIILNMANKGLDIKTISELTSLPQDKIKTFLKEN
jgi:hypothetical protein